MIGQTISNYRVLKKLEPAGLAQVYLAEDIELGRKVVLKFLRPEISSESKTLERFVREAKSAAQLHHPNIATVYKVGEHSGRPFVAMEYVKGRSLPDKIARGSIAPQDAVSIAIQICEGLTAAHKEGLFHPEIRPDHIFIGRGGRVRIADFGFAAPEDLSASSSDMRSFKSQDRPGEGAGDERSDVFSIGALLQEMGGGELFSDIIARAVSKRPDDRYATVEALTTDLLEMQSREYGFRTKRTFATRAARPILVTLLLLLVGAILVVWNPLERSSPVSAESSRQIIAVLPFENLGDTGDEYFADGITDEIAARLARMKGLGVISRTSSRIYKNTQKSVGEIGKELNADFIIEGTIRWDKSRGKGRVRITPQLIRVSDDTHVWANNYEREVTEIFALQANIASQIVEALDVTLHEGEHQALTAKPTDNIDAYQAYLQGMKQLGAPGFSRDSFELGAQMFERAITLDPGFALAHARLSTIHSRFFHYGYDRTDQRLEMAKAAVDSAFSLDLDLAEAHLALGYYYYWGLRDYERALESLYAARERAPNSSEIIQAKAFVKRRQGDLEGCAELIERSLELSPLDGAAAVTLGETYGTLRRYSAGERSLKRGIALAPDDVYPYTELALLYLRWRGDSFTARDILSGMPSASNTEYFRAGFLVELLDRNYGAALDRLAACPNPVLEAGAFFIPIPLFEGITFQLMGEIAGARSAFEASRRVLEENLARNPDDYRLHSSLGVTYAGLGLVQEAVQHGQRAVDLYPMSRDALEAPVMIIDLALIHTMVGQYEEALERLDFVLSIPSILSASWLEKDPRFDPLRKQPQFTALLQKFRIDPES